MGIHTSLLKSTNFDTEYSVRLGRCSKTIEIREEYYIGKSLWAINNWFYRYFQKGYKTKDLSDFDIYENGFFDEYISKECLAKLLSDIDNVLSKKKKPEIVFPNSDDDYIEKYDTLFFETLERLKRVISLMLKDNQTPDSDIEYFVSVG